MDSDETAGGCPRGRTPADDESVTWRVHEVRSSLTGRRADLATAMSVMGLGGAVGSSGSK
jgi:hypothetical protein